MSTEWPIEAVPIKVRAMVAKNFMVLTWSEEMMGQIGSC